MGYGPETLEKLKFFEQFISMHAAICESICRRFNRNYLYLDINAGAGNIEQLNHAGSPILALTVLAEQLPQFKALLIEEDPTNAELLEHSTAQWKDHVDLRRGDHDDVLPKYLDELPQESPQGLLFHDPTGVPNFRLLQRVFKNTKLTRVDVLIYMSAAGYKRKQHASENMPFFLDELSRIHKDKWLVRHPHRKNQWVFLLGTNWGQFPQWEKRKFYSVTDVRGTAILDRLNLTADEWVTKHQPPLF